jgi:hypothetical protein
VALTSGIVFSSHDAQCGHHCAIHLQGLTCRQHVCVLNIDTVPTRQSSDFTGEQSWMIQKNINERSLIFDDMPQLLQVL